jgi:hypothetical protein
MIDPGNIIPRIGFWITIDRVVVEYAHDLCHNLLPLIDIVVRTEEEELVSQGKADRNISGPVQPALALPRLTLIPEAVREVSVNPTATLRKEVVAALTVGLWPAARHQQKPCGRGA